MTDELHEELHTTGPQGAHRSPLDTAAARGDLHWPSDPDLDPEGTPEPLHVPRSNVNETMSGFVGARGFPPN